MTEFADHLWLAGPEAASLVAADGVDARPLHQRLAALRREVGAARAALVVELAEQRWRGADKFGQLAPGLFGGAKQWEQATDVWIAAYKAARFAAAGPRPVHDFCCGMGGDAMALSAAGGVTAWDCDEAAALYAERNLAAVRQAIEAGADGGTVAGASVRCADVTDAAPAASDAWHVDPDRRAGGRRTTTPNLHAPPPETIDRWLQTCPHGAVKLAPATRPWGAWALAAQWEWISRDRQCRQLVAWFGDLRETPVPVGGGLATREMAIQSSGVESRRATRVVRCGDEPGRFHAATFAAEPIPAEAVADELDAVVAEPDPAVIAAELVGALANDQGLSTVGAGGIYLTGPQPPATPLLASFAVEAVVPLRMRDIARELAARQIGTLEIKVRGVSHDPGAVRKRLKLAGDRRATLFLTRVGRREVAILAHRLPPAMP